MTEEWLDSDEARGMELEEVLGQLHKLNSLLGTQKALWTGVKHLFDKTELPSQLVLLDLGCGSGQNLVFVANKMADLGINPILIGIDQNPESLQLAATHCQSFDFTPICTCITDGKPIPKHDILLSSQFLYHFSLAQCQALFEHIAEQNELGIVLVEWSHSNFIQFLFRVYCQLWGYNKHILFDGLVALKKAHSNLFWQKLFSHQKHIYIKNYLLPRTLVYGKLEK